MKKMVGGFLKGIGALFMLLVVIAVAFGGSDDKTPKPSASSTGTESQAAATEEDALAEEAETSEQESEEKGRSIATDSKYTVTINGCRIVEDYDGAPCVAVDYTFTNVSDSSPTSMQLATNITVYQDGVECENAYFASDNSDGYTNKVKAGVSVEVTCVYKLQNTASDVEVEVAPLFSWNDDLLAYEVLKLP